MGMEGFHPYTTLNGYYSCALCKVTVNVNSPYANTSSQKSCEKAIIYKKSCSTELRNLSDCPSVCG